MWEPLLQLSGPAQRAGADHAAQNTAFEVTRKGKRGAWAAGETVPVRRQTVQSFPGILWVQHHGIVGVFSPGEQKSYKRNRRGESTSGDRARAHSLQHGADGEPRGEAGGKVFEGVDHQVDPAGQTGKQGHALF